jgi:ankyrin repeat protein
MRERGHVGEIPLHMCFLYGTDKQIRIGWEMIEKDPSLISEQYNGEDYLGENILHIAIIKKRKDLVIELVAKELINGGTNLLNAQACGNFFKIEKPCYYGEYPLAFAIATNQFNIFTILVDAGADLNIEDSLGNNILHVLVVRNLPEAYKYFKNKWIELYGTDKREDGTFDNNGIFHFDQFHLYYAYYL